MNKDYIYMIFVLKEERVEECLMSWGRLFQMWGPAMTERPQTEIRHFSMWHWTTEMSPCNTHTHTHTHTHTRAERERERERERQRQRDRQTDR